jgi:trigger factor
MQVKETKSEGLARVLEVTISAQDLDARMSSRLDEIKGQVQLKGFRPGKVPADHLRKTYGQQVMSEIVQQVVGESSQQALTDRNERPALQPEIKLVGEAGPILEGKADLVYEMNFEVIPEIKLADFAKMELVRKVAKVSTEQVQDSLSRLASSRQTFTAKDAKEKAKSGDQVKIDFIGRIDGEAFDGGTAEGVNLVLGSGQFIPGFEEQLEGHKAGDGVDVKVTFPEDYGSEALAGKEAIFECKVHEVSAPSETAIDDDFATSLGMENLEKLKEAIEEQIQRDYGQMSRTHLKKALLDALDASHDFELPPAMVNMEFDQIWHQFEHELEHENKKIEDLDEDEDSLRAEYRSIAERRVRTGLVLAEVGTQNKIEVTQEEINQALMERVRQFPGQERQVLEYFQKTPDAMAQVRAPVFEEKVVDFIVELAKVTETEVSLEDLMRDPAEDDDNAAKKPAKKKAAAKKPAAKKAADKADEKKPAAKKAPAKKPAAKKSTAAKPKKAD